MLGGVVKKIFMDKFPSLEKTKPKYALTGFIYYDSMSWELDKMTDETDEQKALKAGRQVCSPEHPMPKGAAGRWAHTNVREVGGCMDGCCADYCCVDCGHMWREELPQ